MCIRDRWIRYWFNSGESLRRRYSSFGRWWETYCVCRGHSQREAAKSCWKVSESKEISRKVSTEDELRSTIYRSARTNTSIYWGWYFWQSRCYQLSKQTSALNESSVLPIHSFFLDLRQDYFIRLFLILSFTHLVVNFTRLPLVKQQLTDTFISVNFIK